MYEITFLATDDANWIETFELFSDTDGTEYDASALDFTLKVKDGASTVLSASTSDATITQPASNQVRWSFTPAQLSALCTGKDYPLGMTMTDGSTTTQIFVGTLRLIDGRAA